MDHCDGIPLTKPKSIWAKPVKFKLPIFKHIFNIFTGVARGNLPKIADHVMDTISDLELKTEIGERGWLLITRALMNAMINLTDEHKHRIHIKDFVSDHLDNQLNVILENEQHYIGFDFFENPKKLRLLEMIQPVYGEFLSDVGFEPAMADNLCNRLTSYFIFALTDEWRRKSDYYQSLEKQIRTPFDRAGKEETEWLHYRAWLKKQPDEPIFDESFSLRQIYVPLRGYYQEKITGEGQNSSNGFKEEAGIPRYQKIVFDLGDKLRAWVDKADKNDAFRIVVGGPGYGKSSFLKVFASQLAEDHKRVLFIPLHRFEIKDDLIDALQKFIHFGGYFTHDPLGDEPLVVIFDGLDELAMQGKVLADAANHFIREIKIKLGYLNTQKIRLQVIVSSRDIIIQANEMEFRNEYQLLHILPYYIEERKRVDYLDPENLLANDLRHFWWENYGKIKGRTYPGLPGELKNPDLDKLTAQPLLNYLVALSYERGSIQFSKHPHLNEIYDDLLKAIHRRSYEESRVHRAVDRLEYHHFVRVLEEIALCAWHGDGRTTTVREIERHCRGCGMEHILKSFTESAKEGIISFMTAFYFRKSGQPFTGEETFEFTHKSFGEFLAARRIIQKIRQMHHKRRARETNFDEGWGDKECLTEWIKLFGPKQLDRDLLKFITNEIQALGQTDKDDVNGMQRTVTRMMNDMLTNGMPMETVGNAQGMRYAYFIENLRAINAEKALLIILSTLSDCTGEISPIIWPSHTAFGEFISRLQGQRTGGKNFILRFLNRLNLENAVLVLKDLYMANLREANLSKAQLQSVNLRFADLRGADLRLADLSGAILIGADLSGADLREADLRRADLSGANLTGADQRGAKI
ncbi:MAG: NACHT domain-containing protein [Candidatus Omnitrophota bacterium]